MQSLQNIQHCYNLTASKYAQKFSAELNGKPFESLYLKDFAERLGRRGRIVDLGCGTGHITQYLFDQGCRDIIGVDLAPGMIDTARQLYPAVTFEVADMRQLPFANRSVAGVVALYSIIHLDEEAIRKALQEMHRILQANGECLISFHIGEGVIHLSEFLGEKTEIDLHLWEVDTVAQFAREAGFVMIEMIERHPHPNIEYQSKRGYLLARKLPDATT